MCVCVCVCRHITGTQCWSQGTQVMHKAVMQKAFYWTFETQKSCRTCEWVMSHIWMSHVTHVNESWHVYPHNRDPVLINVYARLHCTHLAGTQCWWEASRHSVNTIIQTSRVATIHQSWRVLQCVAVYCSVLQCVAVYCSVLQCVAVCCSRFAASVMTRVST